MDELKMFDIIYVDLSGGIGSEQTGIRPCVIIQNNMGNKHCPTVLCMALTSVIKKEKMPTHTIIHRTEENGLKKDSMLLGESLRQVDKQRIISKIGSITDSKTQNEVIKMFIANATGHKVYNSFWEKVINKLICLIKGGQTKNAA